jgi:nitrogen regulatory protein PII
MTLLRAIVRPDKVEAVHEALARIGVSGMTIAEVRGDAIHRPASSPEGELEVKTAIDVIVSRSLVPVVIRAIIGAAQTGEPGDGRILEVPLSNTYSIRTGTRDDPRRPTLRLSD